MGQARELGDGVGALCPSCETWWREVDTAWWEHIVEEHPATAARLRATAARLDARVADGLTLAEATTVRTAIGRDLDATAELLAETRRDRAA